MDALPDVAYVYMVRCTGGQLYTGWTNHPAARLKAHQSGKGVGNVAAPTKYFSEEGSNLFFQVKENDKAVDPLLLLN